MHDSVFMYVTNTKNFPSKAWIHQIMILLNYMHNNSDILLE